MIKYRSLRARKAFAENLTVESGQTVESGRNYFEKPLLCSIHVYLFTENTRSNLDTYLLSTEAMCISAPEACLVGGRKKS
jgi:hypothetical protein